MHAREARPGGRPAEGPRYAAQARAATEVRTFCRFLYDDEHGYAELCYAPADPRDGLKRAGWYAYPEQLDRLAQDAARLAEAHGDVYVSSTLYSRRERREDAARPSRIVFLDDAPEAPEGLPYSAEVATSRRSRHAYYRLDTAAPPAARHALQRRAAAALAADPSGADIAQVVRLPIGANTKGGGREPVRLAHLDLARTYTAEQLAAAFPPVRPPAGSAAGGDLPPDLRAQVEAVLPNIGQLLSAEGIPRRFKPASQSARVLRGELVPVNQAGDADTSTRRAFVARGLILHGYPDAEAVALLIHLTDDGASTRKGSAWLYADCARLIAKERAAHPHITPSASRITRSRLPEPLPEIPRPKRGPGRPPGDRAGRVAKLKRILARRAEDDVTGRITYYRDDLAEDAGVSLRTLQTYLAEMEAAGELRRGQEGGPGGRAWIDLTPRFWGADNPAATPETPAQQAPETFICWGAGDAPEEAIATPETPPETPPCNGEEHTPPHAPNPDPAPDPEPVPAQAGSDAAFWPDGIARSQLAALPPSPKVRPIAEEAPIPPEVWAWPAPPPACQPLAAAPAEAPPPGDPFRPVNLWHLRRPRAAPPPAQPGGAGGGVFPPRGAGPAYDAAGLIRRLKARQGSPAPPPG